MKTMILLWIGVLAVYALGVAITYGRGKVIRLQDMLSIGVVGMIAILISSFCLAVRPVYLVIVMILWIVCILVKLICILR